MGDSHKQVHDDKTDQFVCSFPSTLYRETPCHNIIPNQNSFQVCQALIHITSFLTTTKPEKIRKHTGKKRIREWWINATLHNYRAAVENSSHLTEEIEIIGKMTWCLTEKKRRWANKWICDSRIENLLFSLLSTIQTSSCFLFALNLVGYLNGILARDLRIHLSDNLRRNLTILKKKFQDEHFAEVSPNCVRVNEVRNICIFILFLSRSSLLDGCLSLYGYSDDFEKVKFVSLRDYKNLRRTMFSQLSLFFKKLSFQEGCLD